MIANPVQLRRRCHRWPAFFWRACLATCGVALLLGSALCGRAGEPGELPGFLTRTWDSEDGLPASPIRATARTPDGYLWIATAHGLARFDGARFVVFSTNNTPALGDDRIACLLVDTAGDLWIGTTGGTLARRQAGVFVSLSTVPPSARNPILKLAQDGTGAIWVAASGSGLARWHKGNWDFFTSSQDLPGDPISDLVAVGTNNVWAIAAGQLVRWDGNKWMKVEGWTSADSRLQALAKSRDGGLWVATAYSKSIGGHGGEVLKFKDGQWTLPLPPYSWPYAGMSPRITDLIEDHAGRIWLGTTDAGLLWWETGRPWEMLVPGNEQRQTAVNCLSVDAAGSLWVGYSRSDQLQQVRSRPVKTLHLPAVAGQSRVFAVCASRDGSAWIGTSDEGVFHYRDGQFEHFAAAEGLLDGRIRVLLEDTRTNIWVGTDGGLFRRQGSGFERVYGPKPLKAAVNSLFEDRQGIVWAGTDGGLIRLDGLRSVQVENSANVPINAIQESNDGRLWVAGQSQLFQITEGQLALCDASDQLKGTWIKALYADASGNLWVGTVAHGLWRLNHGQLKHWSMREGLPSNRITAIMEDLAGNLWFSSDNGFFSSSPEQFGAQQHEQNAPLLFRRISSADGLEAKMGSGAGNPVVSRSPDGRLWFPNQFAVAVFDPAVLTTRGWTPDPLIEEVVADGAPLVREADGGLRVKSSLRRFEFRFTAPNLESPARQRFLFRLKGWDTEWVDAGTERAAHYNRLPPGQYEFEVQVGGPDGQWRAAQPALKLEVVPRFWERRLVQLLGALLFLVTVAVVVRTRERMKARRRLRQLEIQQSLERERRRIARDLHDDLGSNLTEIQFLSEEIQRTADAQPGAQQRAIRLNAKVRQTVSAMDQIVWTVNPRNDSVPNLASFLSEYAQEFFRPTSIRCRLDVPVNLPEQALSAMARHEIFLAVKEAFNNVAKHAAAGETWLRIRCSARELEIEIEDNGCGFEAGPRESAGNGLGNMGRRLGGLGGRTEISSQPGRGTRVRFVLPLGDAAPAVQGKAGADGALPDDASGAAPP